MRLAALTLALAISSTAAAESADGGADGPAVDAAAAPAVRRIEIYPKREPDVEEPLTREPLTRREREAEASRDMIAAGVCFGLAVPNLIAMGIGIRILRQPSNDDTGYSLIIGGGPAIGGAIVATILHAIGVPLLIRSIWRSMHLDQLWSFAPPGHFSRQ